MAWYFISGSPALASSIESQFAPSSQIFICATCGEPWAKVFIEGQTWRVTSAPCRQHSWQGVQDFERIPGSILSRLVSKDFVGSGDWGIVIEHLPPALLQRELSLYIEHFLKEQRNHEIPSEANLHTHPREE